MKTTIVRAFLIPIGLIFIPFFSLALWMNPIEMYKDFFEHAKSGQPFGPFDS